MQKNTTQRRYASLALTALAFLWVGFAPTSVDAQNDVDSFTLVDALTDQDIGPLQDGDTLVLDDLPSALNIRANTSPNVVGSVRFGYDGDSSFRTENQPPYALAGDGGGSYHDWVPTVGVHTVVATAYSRRGAKGDSGASLFVSFTVVQSLTSPDPDPAPAPDPDPVPAPEPDPVPEPQPVPVVVPAIDRLVLVDAVTNTDVVELTPGLEIELSGFGGDALTIRAESDGQGIGSVRFDLNGVVGQQVEGAAPYYLNGDANGVPTPFGLAAGLHTVSVTAFESANATGAAGPTLQLSFTLVEASTPPPSAGSIVRVDCFDPVSGTVLDELLDGAIVDAEAFDQQVVGFRASVADASTESVAFQLDGQLIGVDNAAPFEVEVALDGGNGRTLTVIPHSADGAGGVAGAALVRSFDVDVFTPAPTGPQVVQFVLIDTRTNSDVAVLTDGLQVDASGLDLSQLNIRAEVGPDSVGSVRFDLDGVVGVRVENVAPFALGGDSSGLFSSMPMALGPHSVGARAFSGTGATGSAGPGLEMTFTLESSGVSSPPDSGTGDTGGSTDVIVPDSGSGDSGSGDSGSGGSDSGDSGSSDSGSGDSGSGTPSDLPPGTAQGTTTSLSQNGITWTFAQPVTFGQFVNGDYWILGPTTIVSINPPSFNIGGRIQHGSQINPIPTDTPQAPGNAWQGYDNTLYGNYGHPSTHYNLDANVAFEVSASNPLVVNAGDSLVSSITHDQAGVQPGIKTIAILSVLDSIPPDGSFRPPYYDVPKVMLNIADMDLSMLQNYAPTPGMPSWADITDRFSRVWFEQSANWLHSFEHPSDNMEYYGRDQQRDVSVAACMINTDVPLSTKMPLLIGLLQVGIDFDAFIEAGGFWSSTGGGISCGHKFPVVFKRKVFGHSLPIQNPQYIFMEDAQTFVVQETSPGVYNYGQGGYGPQHVGMPEWGMLYWTSIGNNFAAPSPQGSGANGVAWQSGNSSYRRCCNYISSAGYMLSLHMMNMVDDYGWDAGVRYQDRYMIIEPHGDWHRQWDPWTESMWDTYRPSFGDYAIPQSWIPNDAP